MAAYDLDDVDRQILDLLQEDARYTAIELAETVGVSDNTIHNRMERLEEAGVITGYRATVDHDRAGLSLYFHFTCTARISDRADVAEEVMSIPEVIEVTELMTGQQNLHIRMVAADDEDITRLARQLDELALEINDENLVRDERREPVDFDAVGEMLDREE